MDDKQIFYNILEREIDNLFARVNPSFRIFCGPIKNWVCSYVEPYIDFFSENGKLNTRMAKQYVSKEINDKLENFKKEFEEAVNENK